MIELEETRPDPVDVEIARKRLRRRGIYLLLLLIVAAVVYWKIIAQIPVDYESDADHFKYGSIGSDYPNGIPERVWRVLPELFFEYLPEHGAGYLRVPEAERTYLDGYAQCGFLIEPGRPLPIGFSQRRAYVDLVGLNCALCHTSTVKVSDGMDVSKIYGREPSFILRRNRQNSAPTERSVLVLGMPANTLDLEAYFAFLIRSAEDDRFNVDTIMGAVEDAATRTRRPLGAVEKAFLRLRAIPQLRATLLTRRQQLHYLSLLPHAATATQVMPPFGPGRVDTFTPYKSIQFGFPYDGKYGIADYPSIWNQRPREAMHLHWDGNNESVFERNISASIGAGVTPVSLDLHRMNRVAKWLGSPPQESTNDLRTIAEYRKDPFPKAGELPIPGYPFDRNPLLVGQGATLYADYCYSCHDWQGRRIGEVVDIKQIGTDPARLDSYTEELQANQNFLGAGQNWRFKHFRKTHGYSNMPLDGVWVRAPYLHNGSVPTLRDLLNRPCGPADWARLGLSADTDFAELAADPARVAAIIAQSRALGLRPPIFYRGDDEYEHTRGGFRGDRAVTDYGRRLFFYSTLTVADGRLKTALGNGHAGHLYGTTLTDDEKQAIVEYQKTIGERTP